LYDNIMVAVDNSECSRHAVDLSIEMARALGARLTGIHVYAARLHDARFRQLEPGLPDRYRAEDALERLRGIHGDLIGRGLGIISDSYLDDFEVRCREVGVEATRKTPEGRNYLRLVEDARESGYDLVAIGAHGLGRVDRSVLGSVCERVARLVECDLLVVRNGRLPGTEPLLVAIDGSAHSFAALRVALHLGRAFGSPVSAVAAYDPFFHGAAFRGLAGVLSGEAARLFRFEEQERLHGEIIDGGLAAVYRGHLLEAQEVAAREGQLLGIDLVEGKPFDAIASHVEVVRPPLLIVGRIGVHHSDGVTMGSTAENLLRLAGCNVLVVNRGVDRQAAATSTIEAAARPPDTAGQASEADVWWSPEAELRLGRVPSFVRKMVRRRMEGFARERGFREITPEVYDQARQRFGMGGGSLS
jgi:nucleotide-binding universal stress UspA family protein